MDDEPCLDDEPYLDDEEDLDKLSGAGRDETGRERTNLDEGFRWLLSPMMSCGGCSFCGACFEEWKDCWMNLGGVVTFGQERQVFGVLQH